MRNSEHGYMDAEDILFGIVFIGIVGGFVLLILTIAFATDTHSTTYVVDTKENIVVENEWHEKCHFTLSFDKCDPVVLEGMLQAEYDTRRGEVINAPKEVAEAIQQIEDDMPRGVYALPGTMED
jgi:hypothetical protein